MPSISKSRPAIIDNTHFSAKLQSICKGDGDIRAGTGDGDVCAGNA